MKVYHSYPENTDVLDEHLKNDDDNENDAIAVSEIIKKNLKCKEEMFDEIIVERLD